ncbi:MAG: HAMP domain-containing histidine kinase [Clostridiales bacterium]|nr:HAMP domain-containing histidine kinase [Clostridiales bacterium]
MNINNTKTHFAPPDRKDYKAIVKEAEIFSSNNEVSSVIDAIPHKSVILNEERQIIYANSAMLEFSDVKSFSEILGKRLGELLACIHSKDMEAGCGTSKNCRLCGAGKAIMEAQRLNRLIGDECRICKMTKENIIDYRDYEVKVSPIGLDDYDFYLLTINDISSKERVKNLENIFYHDIKNLAGGMGGIIHLLQNENDREVKKEYVTHLKDASSMLLTMIDSQLELIHAERGDFKVVLSPIESSSFVDSTLNQMKNHPVSKNIVFKIEEHIPFGFVTDLRLISQVAINMIKNAAEASEDNSTVGIAIKLEENQVILTVHNDGYIPEDIQHQIFNYSFSTKGSGRGIGTYGMSLIAKRYLEGDIHFESDSVNGTDFILEIPFKDIDSYDITP